MKIWIVEHSEYGDVITDGHFSSEEKAQAAMAALGDAYERWIDEVELDPELKRIPKLTYASSPKAGSMHHAAQPGDGHAGYSHWIEPPVK